MNLDELRLENGERDEEMLKRLAAITVASFSTRLAGILGKKLAEYEVAKDEEEGEKKAKEMLEKLKKEEVAKIIEAVVV